MNNAEVLLNDNPTTFYWIGFLLADGYYNPKRREINTNLSDKDYDHLIKLKEYIKSDICLQPISLKRKGKIYNSHRLSINNKYNEEIVNKFDWKPRKTYNPPNIEIFSKFSDILNICLFIGFIDGDGSITRTNNNLNCSVRIAVHYNWINVLYTHKNIIENYFGYKIPPIKTKYHKTKIFGEEYTGNLAILNISNYELIKEMKRFSIKYELPTMERKWSRIDIGHIKTVDKKRIKKIDMVEKIFILKEEGCSLKYISQKLNIPINTIIGYIYNKKRNYYYLQIKQSHRENNL